MAKVSSIIREDAFAVAERWSARLAPLKDTTLLVTGAGGFLCSFILDVIAALNDRGSGPVRVIALDNFKTGLPERVDHLKTDPHFTFVTHDVTTPYSFRDSLDWIIHGASIASPPAYRRFPLETIDVNVTGTRLMLELARLARVKGFVQLSSSEIYGDPDPAMVPTAEDYFGYVSCTGPRACYDESKRLGETLALAYFRLHGIPAKIVRPFNVYGPGQRLDDGRIIPDLLSAAVRDVPIVLYSDGRATRAFCYVADFVAGLLLVMIDGKDGEAYNVGNDREVTIAEAAETMATIARSSKVTVTYSKSADPKYLTDNPQRRCPNISKVVGATGWRPAIQLDRGLERALRSYREELAIA